MRYLSLFSGIEAVSVAVRGMGWEPVAFAEIEPFPCAVLAHHWPDVPNLGDITKITEQQIRDLGHIDCVFYGFPCQDLSVAGKRKGLKHADGTQTRSGLFYRAAEIIRWSRARWSVAENVPGLFSSHGGSDFAAVVGELAGCEVFVPRDGWRSSGFALGTQGLVEWTVLDAQWRGVAQRRRRVFIVRDAGDWSGRPPLLLERDSMQGYPPPRRETGQGAAADVVPSLTGSGRGTARTGETRGQDPVIACWSAVAMPLMDRDAQGQDGFTAGIVSPPICASDGGASGVPSVQAGPSSCVRRLTPTECERLMGFHDGHTLIPWRGKPPEQCPDGPRYKALGNSMAVPVIRWIAERIDTAAKSGE